MHLSNVRTIGLAVASLVAACMVCNAQARGATGTYPRMAPVDQYLMANRAQEVALARTAAPASISRDAQVFVLGRHGFEAAAKGTNGFVCLVDRAWDAGFESAEFWNPKTRGPVCFNPAAARSLLPLLLARARLALDGLTIAQIKDSTDAATASKRNPALEPGAICYMMSKEAYLTDRDDHNLSHLMLYTPQVDAAALGADVHGSPVILGQRSVPGAPAPVTEFYVAVPLWSDGTPATGK